MKKLIRLLLVLALVALLIPNVFAESYNGSCGTGVTWTLDTETGVLNIRGTGDMKDFGAYAAPWYNYRDSITSVVIEPGVTAIGNYAFTKAANLASISIPEGVTRIGDYAFRFTEKLAEIKLPESLTAIGDYAFSSCEALTRIKIPAKVKTLGDYAFSHNDSLTAVLMSEGLYDIGDSVFRFDEQLVHALLPDSVMSLGNYAFQNCYKLQAANVSDYINTIDEGCFQNCKSLYSLELGSNLQTVEMFAFDGCESLKKVKLPESLQTIGQSAFRNTALEQIVLPASVTFVDIYCFSGCESLRKVAVLNPDCLVYSGNIYDDSLGIAGIATIYCHQSTTTTQYRYTAYQFADAHGHAYEFINGENLWTDTFVPAPVIDEWQFAVNPFTDVTNSGIYYYSPVLWAYYNGVTTGTSATTFGPDGYCQRGQVVTFLWRAMGSPEPTSTTCPFVDVQPNAYYYKAVMWAYENGITTGIDATHFGPTKQVTRGQFVTFLWRTMNKPTAAGSVSFTDVPANQYYYNAVLWAADTGVTTGTSATTFGPDKTCTRAQVVTFLYRCLAD